ncbi:MAG: hypothetical protein K2P51_08235 [Rhabdochlamydiaceae bacterium]|nr:hypothetical protein [Rhabdochlamydiaceae bacterium]
MKHSWFLFLLSTSILHAQPDSYSIDRLDIFYDDFLEEQAAILGASGAGGVTPTPPSGTLDPAPISGYLPVVISNTTGQPDDQVYVLLAGQQTALNLEQFFFQLTTGGILTPVSASSSTFSVNYSYPLTSLPRSSTGSHDYLVYVSSLSGARFYFSIGSPIYLQSDTLVGSPPNQIVAPTYYAFYDPNYCNLYESVEVTFFPSGGGSAPAIPWTASVNTTEVDAFGLPIRISYFSYNSESPSALTPLVQNPNALPSGFGVGGAANNTTRSEILTTVVNGLTSGDLTGQTPKIWPKLALPFYSNPYAGTGLQTYLRVLSPKQSLGNAASPATVGNITIQHLPAVQPGPVQYKNYNYPPFPSDYLSATTYGDTNGFATDLFNYYTGMTKLYISTGGASPTVYEGTSDGSTLTFTGISGPNTGQVNTLTKASLNTFDMYSGVQPVSGGSDASALGHFFGDAFTVGFLASAVGTQNTMTPPNIPINITDAVTWEPTFITDYYIPQYSLMGGPWMDLYAKMFHSVAVRNSVSGFLNDQGLCYAYDFDDSLGISGTITPSNLTPNSLNPFLGITLGSIDTPIPDPYSDPNSYTVVFTFPGMTSLQYQQGDGQWNTVMNSGDSFGGIYSNKTNPLRIRYTNNTGLHEFVVYLYYQFLQPVNAYTSNEISIINSTTITPNSATPTLFTINLLP